jgi:hypothetical protein
MSKKPLYLIAVATVCVIASAIFADGGEIRGPENPGGRLYVFSLP